jgi:prepilin-type N-terminal cleavage/methylation domain-containing protein
MMRAESAGGGASRRPGFTLLELLIVVAIMAALVALTAAATLRFIGAQQQNVSQLIVTNVASALDKQWQAVIDAAYKEPISSQALALANSNTGVARIIHVKLRLQQEFPMSYTEILSPNASALPALPTYVSALNKFSITSGGSPPTPAENSACLLMALTLSPKSGLVANAEDFGLNALRDTNSDGLQELIDGYGTPIVYFRWPWNNSEMTGSPGYFPAVAGGTPGLNPATAEPYLSSFKDPQDKEGLLLNMNWNNNSTNAANVTTFETICHAVHDWSQSNYTPAAYYMVPAVASAGPNLNFGLDLTPGVGSPLVSGGPPSGGMAVLPVTLSSTAVNDSNDNIYSYRLRLGGASR